MAQALYWLLTIPVHDFTLYLPPPVAYLRGQIEDGEQTGYRHWQLLAVFTKKIRLAGVKDVFGPTCHAEPSRSSAADDYVWKEDTAVAGTRFELGHRRHKRNCAADWDAIWEHAKHGRIDEIPANVRVTNYRTLKQIEKDHLQPVAIERTVYCFWGTTGSGKSRRAWEEAGLSAYPKDPRTKFWDGYQGGDNVVIDEFRGDIDISHILRWFDRYPCIVEQKFGASTLRASRIWITSNVDPRDWYPNICDETRQALLRRLTITHFNIPFIV